MSFAYDANGRMVKASKTNTPDAWTVFDALGNRVATKINDVWQFVIYDAFGKLVAEYGMAGEGRGGVSWVLQDWQGSVRASVNSNGFISARFDFTAFGEKISLGVGLRTIDQGYSAPQNSRQGYGLTETDSATGLDHTWFRKNENRAGRWTSPDPYKGSMSLASSGSFNRYSYVGNEPTNFVDPSGLYWALQGCETIWYWETGDFPGGIRYTAIGEVCTYYWINSGPSGGGGPIDTGGGGGGQTSEQKKVCGVAPITPITDVAAQNFEAGNGNEINMIDMTRGTVDAYNCLANAISAVRGSISINSGYRPQAYQDHLREVWDKAQALRNNSQPECQATKSAAESELNKHGITERPAAVSNHSSGTAFDVSIRGATGGQINSAASSCSLSRGQGHGGGHHFNFIGREPQSDDIQPGRSIFVVRGP